MRKFQIRRKSGNSSTSTITITPDRVTVKLSYLDINIEHKLIDFAHQVSLMSQDIEQSYRGNLDITRNKITVYSDNREKSITFTLDSFGIMTRKDKIK